MPHHTGVASTASAASSETSVVQDCLRCAPVTGFKSADVHHCRHSTRLRAWSSFSPLIFLQDTRCSTDTQQFWRQKLCCCGTTPVEQFTYTNLRQMTSYGQFRRHLKSHLFMDF